MIIKAHLPCGCGSYKLKIVRDFIGFYGNKPCYEETGYCTKCKKEHRQHEIDKRFGVCK